MANKLSVIIPCYNCEKTLTEAVDSVFRQNIDIPYEVVMVDDGSTDSTKELIAELSGKYKNIKNFFHDVNKGGGAARNTAVANSTGNIIFCLDSDDLLADGTLGKMVNYFQSHEVDGVGVAFSHKFRGTDLSDVVYVNNFAYVGEKIPLESIFKEGGMKCSLLSTFLHTRESFERIGGYPTDHGFDTQGFAFRFLANGFEGHTCPDTTYYHRVNFHRSYYLREYESGKASHNWYKIIEEFLFLFDKDLRNKVLSFDLNDHNQPLLAFVIAQKKIFADNYEILLKPGLKELYSDLVLNNKPDATDYFWLGSEEYKKGNNDKAAMYLMEAIKNGIKCDQAYHRIYDSLARLNGMDYGKVSDRIRAMNNYKVLGSRLPLYVRASNKLRRLLGLNR